MRLEEITLTWRSLASLSGFAGGEGGCCSVRPYGHLSRDLLGSRGGVVPPQPLTSPWSGGLQMRPGCVHSCGLLAAAAADTSPPPPTCGLMRASLGEALKGLRVA